MRERLVQVLDSGDSEQLTDPPTAHVMRRFWSCAELLSAPCARRGDARVVDLSEWAHMRRGF
jgi:hypothetical protein